MTPGERSAIRIFASARIVLLDFDGPVCNVFAGRPAAGVAERLRSLLDGLDLPVDVAATSDPLHVLRRAADLDRSRIPRLDSALTAEETEATSTSAPTVGADDLLHSCRAAGRRVAVVSNNSAAAVHAYLDRHRLAPLVQHVQGRDPRDPGLMKPHPHPVERALTALGAQACDAALVGDSLADIGAARAAGVRVIAYAGTPDKVGRLAHADGLTTRLEVLTRVNLR